LHNIGTKINYFKLYTAASSRSRYSDKWVSAESLL